MTEITQGEIKLIYIQILVMAIVGVFIFLYSAQPITQGYAINSQVSSQNTSVSATDAGWMNTLMPANAGLGGLLPQGGAELIIVASIFLIPLTIMNTFTVIRFVKDMATQWI